MTRPGKKEVASPCARDPIESVMPQDAYLITDSFASHTEDIYVFILSLWIVQAIFCVEGQRSRDAVPMKAIIVGVSLNGKTSCQGALIGPNLITDSLDSRN